MNEEIIIAENISKLFQISHEGNQGYTALRDVLANRVKNLFNTNSSSGTTEEFWALKDLSFSIKQGDRLGVIGRNGAGKSTLLKLLSRISEPSSGRITIKGRIASLLEVGTGFHPELTGRENIYLNGAILGMSRTEIKSKFDEIVDFAEIERFLDTPVKRYSSGMYVRLAFAVAAHLEPEILIVDEVLAVGDVQFQNKCLGKMDDVSKKDGRTVIFVSHNMNAIRSLCNRGLLLKKGRIAIDGTVEDVINDYMMENESTKSNVYTAEKSTLNPYFRSVELSTPKIQYNEDVKLDICIESGIPTQLGIEVEIHDERGQRVSYSSTSPMQGELIKIQENESINIELNINKLQLASGEYFIYLWLIKPWAEEYDHISTPFKFSINFSDPFNSGFDFKQSYNRGSAHHHLTVSSK